MAINKQQKISVGDRVRFIFGTSPVEATVVEDRGPIGVGKARIFRILLPNDPYDDMVFEMPEDEVDFVAPDTSRDNEITAAEAADYLARGGLVQILRSAAASENYGDTPPSHAWLLRDSLGNVTHTFTPRRGVVGGAVIPFSVLRDNRVFAPKREDVLTYLTTFGLSAQDADDVLQSVGTAS